MFTPNDKKQSNYYVLETESKTKSSSIKDEIETIMTNTNKNTNKKIKIKRNKTSVLNLNNSSSRNTQISIKKNNLNNKDLYIKEDEIMQNKNINFFKTNYNLAEAYLRNNVLEKLQKNQILQKCKRMHYFNAFEYINLRDKIDNINSINKNLSFNSKNSTNSNGLNKNEDEQLEDDKLVNFTSSYRDKMINKLKIKLNKDYIVDDSLTELQSEKQPYLIENKPYRYKNSILHFTNENKTKKMEWISKTNYNGCKNKISFSKNKKSNLLFKDILNNKLNNKKALFLGKKNFISNKNYNNNLSQLPKKLSAKKNKKENIFNNYINNTDCFKKKFINIIIQKNLDNKYSLNKNKTINNGKTSWKKSCIMKNNKLTYRNSLSNFVNTCNKKVISKSSNKNQKKQKRIMVINNIKNKIIDNNDNKINFNRTMVNENNYKKLSSMLKTNKKVEELNKNSNFNHTDLNLKNSIKYINNINYKKSDKKNFCKTYKNKTKINIDLIPPSLIESILKSKDNNLNLTSKLNKSNNSNNKDFNINKYFNFNKKSKLKH